MRTYLLFLVLGMAGCSSHAGPFVTNVSNAGDGLMVEKCMVEFSQWNNGVSTSDCSSYAIDVPSHREVREVPREPGFISSPHSMKQR